MPVLKPPKPGGGGLKAEIDKEEVWTIVLKPGEVINIEYS